jgi:hypothetical protein
VIPSRQRSRYRAQERREAQLAFLAIEKLEWVEKERYKGH